MIAAVAAVFLAIAVPLWLSERGRMARSASAASLALRLAAAGLLLSLAFGVDPMSLLRAPVRPRVAVVVDNSQSMGLRDGTASSRWQTAGRIARQLAGRRDIDGTVNAMAPAAPDRPMTESMPSGRSSDLARGIGLAARDKPDAIVLLSDGDHHAGQSPVLAAAGAGIAVYTVGLGPAAGPAVPAISDIACPDQVGSGQPFTLRVSLHGVDGPGLLELSERGGSVQRVPLRPGVGAVDIPMMAGDHGLHRYLLTLSRGGSISDRRAFPVMVSKNRITVAWVGVGLDWNLRFFAQALAAAPGIDLFIEQPGGATGPQAGLPLDSICGRDVVVIAAAGPGWSGKELWRSIARTVVPRGGGVLVIGDAGQDAPSWLPLSPGGPRQQLSGPVQLADGWRHAAVFAGCDSAAMARLQRGPAFTLPGTYIRADSGVSILAYIRPAGHAPVPWWAAGFAGRSRVMQCASPDLWHWKLPLAGAFSDTSCYDQLAVNAVRWLAGAEQRGFALAPERGFYYDNEAVTFRAQLQNVAGHAPDAIRWNVLLSGPNGLRRSLPLLEWGDGSFAAEAGNLPAGTYAYQGSVTLDGRELDRQQGTFFVEPAVDELRDAAQNRELLRQIAAVSGGGYCDADSLPAGRPWPQRFPSSAAGRRSGSGASLTALLAIALLSAEWLLRRRHGLR